MKHQNWYVVKAEGFHLYDGVYANSFDAFHSADSLKAKFNMINFYVIQLPTEDRSFMRSDMAYIAQQQEVLERSNQNLIDQLEKEE
mgnify:FL=1|tara:strand:- start:161 stop:418 length:258 start_codon:yes stop_codon:yes gene_type:complete